MNKTAKWTLAILLSLAVHAGAAILFMPSADMPVESASEGVASMEVAVLGNAFEDAIESGAVTETVDPVETPPEETAPVEPETTQAMTETLPEPEAVTPPVMPDITPPDTVAPSETADIAPSDADVILPADEIPPVTSEEPEVVASVPPVSTVVPELRPEQPPEPVRKAAPRKPPPPRKAGDDGTSREAARKGRADGAAVASAASSGGHGASEGASGSAAVSKYPDRVRAKLNRAFRYPSEARRAGLKGTAQVRFVVSASGAVSGVRIARSTGSPVLDEAALDAVQRAAPFPKIPDDAGRTSWVFTIPLAFTR